MTILNFIARLIESLHFISPTETMTVCILTRDEDGCVIRRRAAKISHYSGTLHPVVYVEESHLEYIGDIYD